MEFLTQPKSMVMEGDIADNWRRFKADYEIYTKASGVSEKTKAVQAAVLLHCIGRDAREIFKTFDLTEEDKDDPAKIMTQYDKYFLPMTNKSVERHKFNQRMQQAGESFEEFLADLRKISKNCEFGNMKDDLIVDRIVCGIKDTRVKNRLLREKNLDLQKTIDICKAAEEADHLVKNLEKTNLNVDRIYKPAKEKAGNGTRPKSQESRTDNTTRPKMTSAAQWQRRPNAQTKHYEQREVCSKCGYQHWVSGRCPARGQMCSKCNKANHFARMCKVRTNIRAIKTDDLDNELNDVVDIQETNDTTDDDIDETDYTLGNIEVNCLQDEWYQKLKILNCNEVVNFKLDCGADCNVIPFDLYQKLKLPMDILKRCKNQVRNYEGSKLNVVGYCMLEILLQNKICELEFVIIKVNEGAKPVLGIKTIKDLNLLIKPSNVDSLQLLQTKEQIINDNGDIFKGVGKIKIPPCDITLKTNYVPAVAACRKVPFQLLKPLKAELDRMKKDGVITEINEATEFVNPIVLVKKSNGTIRICLDPKKLNDALMRERYELPTFEELTHNMVGARYFSILDASKGFWQIPLSNRASRLTTFITPYGRFRFLRLPFGLKNAPEIFHRVFTDIFGGIQGTKIYIDDIIVYAKSKVEHNKILQQIFNQARRYGVKFNKLKCEFALTEIKYVGHIISKEGIKADPDKIEAIKRIKTPQNSKDLQRFLGMVNYLAKFIPNLPNLTPNLRALIKKNVIWQWTECHEKEFNHLKEILSTRPVLQFFDENSKLVLSVDSSSEGLGAVLLQNKAPVAYASKTLTDTQRNYAQIEKELLAIVFGCQRFRQYIYGKRILVETDHKPLESIFKKNIEKCPLRLQRLLINLQNYDIEVKYVPGAKLYLADTLSRASYNDASFEILENDTEAHVGLIRYTNISPMQFTRLQQETQIDQELQLLKNIIKVGWPDSKKKADNLIRPYWKHRHEITEIKGILCKNNQLIIPKSMRKEIITRLHYSHLGMEKTINKAKELVFWPFMAKEITDVIKNCAPCLKFSNSQKKETLINRYLPTRPWEIIAADFFNCNGNDYLLVVDCYSKFPEVVLCKTTISTVVITHMKDICARHGKPNVLYSDNGPQFTNSQFQKFLEDWEITHKTSSPRFPQSNGFIERQVQIMKKLMKKAHYDQKDLYMALLEYRNTPLNKGMPSPAELLFGRKIKGIVPVNDKLLTPYYRFKFYDKQLKIKQNEQKAYFDQRARNLHENLKKNDIVVVQNEMKEWEPGKILDKNSYRPRSYNIRLKNNENVISRNRKHIKKIDRDNFVTNDDLFNELLDNQLDTKTNNDINNDYDKNTQLDLKTEHDSQGTANAKSESAEKEKRRTKSGRIVKKPSYLKDYCMSLLYVY